MSVLDRKRRSAIDDDSMGVGINKSWKLNVIHLDMRSWFLTMEIEGEGWS